MYSHFQLAKKYLHYYLTASSGKGHGIHSPFVFNFVKNVLNDKKQVQQSAEIEKLRSCLLHNNTSIQVEDFGAGSGVIRTSNRIVKRIAASSLKPKKYAALLARIAKYFKCNTIIELGTSFGISAAYLAVSNPLSTIYSLEGSENISNIARHNFTVLGLQNIHLIKGDFENTLPDLFSKINKIDLAFIDGNHRKEPTIYYFDLLLKKVNDHSILIFDDIHWSTEMEEAWEQIKEHPSVTLTIDLFFLGLVFFNKDFKVKQHFIIRY
jgi:predicted O-methyltransferase YrrM